eukprot:9220898-Lingulodinium_polyedra.AAC.1
MPTVLYDDAPGRTLASRTSGRKRGRLNLTKICAYQELRVNRRVRLKHWPSEGLYAPWEDANANETCAAINTEFPNA